MMAATAVIGVALGAVARYNKSQDYQPPAPTPQHAAMVEIAKNAVAGSAAGAIQRRMRQLSSTAAGS
jgi:hypothetical protein